MPARRSPIARAAVAAGDGALITWSIGVVLGRNLFEIPHHEIAATSVSLTMRGGRITHEAVT